MAPAVGHVLPVDGKAGGRCGGLAERHAQRAPDVALEKVVARTGVEQHEHAPTLFHLLFDGIDLHLAEERVLVTGLEARQLLGRRFHRCWLSFLKSRGCRSVASAAVYGRGPCGTRRPDGVPRGTAGRNPVPRLPRPAAVPTRTLAPVLPRSP